MTVVAEEMLCCTSLRIWPYVLLCGRRVNEIYILSAKQTEESNQGKEKNWKIQLETFTSEKSDLCLCNKETKAQAEKVNNNHQLFSPKATW